jgi:DNA-damage-inducible protein J
MSKTAVVRSRIESDLKSDVEGILKRLGVTSSDVVQMLFHQIKLRKGIPFEVALPNALTVKTLSDSRKGRNVKRYPSRQAMYDDLGL